MRRRSALFFPLLLVGSLFYWTIALSLGGVSLALLGVSGEDLELSSPEVIPPRVASGEPILVHLQSLNDADGTSAGAPAQAAALSAQSVDDESVPVTLQNDDQAVADEAPGRTAY